MRRSARRSSRPSLVRAVRTLPLLGALASAMTACRGGDAAPDRRTFVDSRDTYDPRTLDPARATDVPTGRAVSYLFDGLVRFTPEAEVVPALAERWEVSADGTTYTFHLRRGVTFHDGTPLRAAHVASSWRRALDPATKGGPWPLLPIRGATAVAEGKATTLEGVRVVDDSTVVVTLAEPLAIFPKLLAMPVAAIVPENAGADFSERPVGTGPWKLVEWKHDDYVKFARFDAHWGDKPGADTLVARIIPEPSTAVAEFESGTVDVMNVPEGETRAWEQTDEKSARLQSAPALILYHVAINTTRGPLADARVRRALNHSVDVNAILGQILAGRGRVATGVIAPSLGGADTLRQRFAYDTLLSRRLLAEAGHPNGVDVELWSSSDATLARLAQSIQGYLTKGGFRVKLVQRDAAAAREAARNGQADLFVKTWYADYPDADAFLYPLLHSASKGVGGNYSFYANRAVDSLVVAARRTQDDGQRAALSRQADALAHADAPMIYLFHYNELLAVQPWIKGFQVPVIFNGQRWQSVRLDAATAR